MLRGGCAVLRGPSPAFSGMFVRAEREGSE